MRVLLLALAIGCQTPTYYHDVEPLLQEHCATCHQPGGIGPFSLLTAEDARQNAPMIALTVKDRTMPPWPPSQAGVALQHSRALSDAQLKTIVDWAEGGTPLGNAGDHVERTPSLPTIEATASLAMQEPYTPSSMLLDDYRCFVLDPHLTQDVFVTGHDIAPGQAASVHHVILFNVAADVSDQLQTLDDADPGPGYTCFGGPMVEASNPLSAFGFLGGWAPGGGATLYPEGTGLKVTAGSRIVMQVHYNTLVNRDPDLTAAKLQYTTAQKTQAIVLPVVDFDFVVPPHGTHEVVRPFVMPSYLPTVRAWATFPHMHTKGREISVKLNDTTLIDIPRWDFHWQGQYTFEQPVTIKAGDTVTLRCFFDNTDGGSALRWGEGTGDEMCLSFFYLTL